MSGRPPGRDVGKVSVSLEADPENELWRLFCRHLFSLCFCLSLFPKQFDFLGESLLAARMMAASSRGVVVTIDDNYLVGGAVQ